MKKFLKDFGDPWPFVFLGLAPVLIVLVLKGCGWID
jgi:hypothetical protein